MKSPRDLERYGGSLCLDFINTLDWRGRAQPEEYLCRFEDLLEWSVLAGALTPAQAEPLARTPHSTAQKALMRAVQFREAAYRVLIAHVDGAAPHERDMEMLNAAIVQARSHAKLRTVRNRFAWSLERAGDSPQMPLWTIAISLADLLTSEDLQHVRRCGSAECGWVFLDTTKNHQRRWCSMEGCGNRAKARRFYQRTR